MGFLPTITEFRSDDLTDWAIKTWVQLVLRAKFLQLLQFHLFVQCSHLISVIAFVTRHICFKRNLAQVITLVAEWINTYGIHHRKIFEVAIAVASSNPTEGEISSELKNSSVVNMVCIDLSQY